MRTHFAKLAWCVLVVLFVGRTYSVHAFDMQSFVDRFEQEAEHLLRNAAVTYEVAIELEPAFRDRMELAGAYSHLVHEVARCGVEYRFARSLPIWSADAASARRHGSQIFIRTYDGRTTRSNSLLTLAPKDVDAFFARAGGDGAPLARMGLSSVEADGSVESSATGPEDRFLHEDYFAEGFYKQLGLLAPATPWVVVLRNGTLQVVGEHEGVVELTVSMSTPKEWEPYTASKEEAAAKAAAHFFRLKVDTTKSFRVVDVQRWQDGKCTAHLKDVVLEFDSGLNAWYPAKYTETIAGSQTIDFRVRDLRKFAPSRRDLADIWVDGQQIVELPDRVAYRFLDESRVVGVHSGTPVVNSRPAGGNEVLTWDASRTREVRAIVRPQVAIP